MYAIFQDGGHQYKAEIGKEIYVNLREVEPEKGIEFDQVLAVRKSDEEFLVGQPFVAGAKVVASVEGKVKGPKLVIRKFRRRKNFKKKTGHRQAYIKVVVKEIVVE